LKRFKDERRLGGECVEGGGKEALRTNRAAPLMVEDSGRIWHKTLHNHWGVVLVGAVVLAW
jgi:hypothetical protein